MLTTS